MIGRHLRVLLAAFVLVLVASCARGARGPGADARLGAHGIPGSRLRLRLPDGFVRPMRAPIFLDRAHGLTVALVEGELEAASDDEFMNGMKKGASKKWRDVHTTDLQRADASGFVTFGTTEGGSQRMLIGLHRGTAFGAVAIDSPIASLALAQTIADSVWLDASATFDPAMVHGLTLGVAEGLVVWKTMAPPIMIVEAGARPPIPPTSAGMMLMVLPATNEEAVKELLESILEDKKVARTTLTSTDVTIDGTPAVELTGDENDKPMPLKFFCMVMDDPGSMIIATGSYAPDRPQDLERLRAVVRGMHRVPDTIGPIKLP